VQEEAGQAAGGHGEGNERSESKKTRGREGERRRKLERVSLY